MVAKIQMYFLAPYGQYTVLVLLEAAAPLTEHHTILLIILQPRTSLNPVTVESPFLGWWQCRLLAILFAVSLINSRGGHSRDLCKSKPFEHHVCRPCEASVSPCIKHVPRSLITVLISKWEQVNGKVNASFVSDEHRARYCNR